MTFCHLLAFHMYNAGVKKTDSKLAMTARTALGPLLYDS